MGVEKVASHCPPPRRPSWAALLAGWLDTEPALLRAALTADPVTSFFAIVTWNVSWLVDAATDIARAKRVRIEEELGRGRPVCLQETHWTVTDGSLWPLGLLVRNTYWSAATSRASLDAALAAADPVWAEGEHAHQDDIDGRLGGVITLLPTGSEFVRNECRTLIPGHAIFTPVVDRWGTRRAIMNVYARPEDPRGFWSALWAIAGPSVIDDPDLVVVGDFNGDLTRFDPAEADCNPAAPPFDTHGLMVIRPTEHTCKRGRIQRVLDGALVRPGEGAYWDAKVNFAPVSDHGIVRLTLSPCSAPSRCVGCSPAAFWNLPADARTELRGSLARVAVALGVPPISGEDVVLPSPTCSVPGVAPPDHMTDSLLPSNHRASPHGRTAPLSRDEILAEPCPLLPLVAAWASPFFTATFLAWWDKWRRRGHHGAPERAELASIAERRSDAVVHPSPELKQWLEAMEGPDSLTPALARQWLCAWDTIARSSREARLSVRANGPSVERQRAPRFVRAGRAVHGRTGTSGRLTLEDGATVTDPRRIACALLNTRWDIWFGSEAWRLDPDLGLEAYMAGRSHTVPADPPVGLAFLRASVLCPSASGVGKDGVPYEALQLHPQLAACWLAQAFHMAHALGHTVLARVGTDPYQPVANILDRVLGTAVDLTIWMPKAGVTFAIKGQRPLSLPTTIRRLLGAASARVIGPGIEPSLEPAQAAVRWGFMYAQHRACLQAPTCGPPAAAGPPPALSMGL